MFRLDVFNASFEYVSAVMIDDHQSIDLDYLTYSPYTVRCKEISAQKGFFTHITDEDNNTIADGIIADIKPEKKTQTITIRPLNALFDADVFYTPVSDAISWLASNIQQAFMTNSDTYQNRPINLTYTVASEQLPLTGFNLHETINILSVMISALKTYGVVVESTLDLVNKRISVNIFRQEATKTILADLENLISSQVTIGDPFGSTNKATLRKIRVNDDESTTILGDFNFYLHPDGSIDQSNTNRIQPVFWEMETLQLEDDMTDAQWLAAATARAKEILEPAKFDNEIILRYQQADKLVYPLELPIGAQCEIHLKGEIYASLLTGKALEGKTVTLYFGVVRTDLTKQLSIKNRETFSFESTVKAVMDSVSEKYPNKTTYNADIEALKAKTQHLSTQGQRFEGESIEFKANSSSGGYIDFHYRGSTDDYTSRIIENSSGRLSVVAPNGFLVNGLEVNGRPWNSTPGASGTNGYVCVAKIIVKAVYANSPIQFIIAQRRLESPVRVNIMFTSVNSLDPAVDYFTYQAISTGNRYFLLKTATSTWEFYVQKTEAYDLVDVIDLLMGKYAKDHLTVTPESSIRTSAPTWTKTATKITD